MKKFIIIFLIIFGTSCDRHINDLYYNIDLIIVKMNNDSSLSNDKFHTPQTCNTVLLKTVYKKPELYTELNDCDARRNYYNKFNIDKISWWYNHNVGDTIHFDYIRKDRFFEIKK